eukprot:COSAG01_NODE_246_length_20450_cov_195.166822_32_plen_81_part_00
MVQRNNTGVVERRQSHLLPEPTVCARRGQESEGTDEGGGKKERPHRGQDVLSALCSAAARAPRRAQRGRGACLLLPAAGC